MIANTAQFAKLIEDVEIKGSVQQAIEKAQGLYGLKTYKISQISASQAIKIYESIYIKFYKGHLQAISSSWYQNQLRIFVWSLACYIYLKQRFIEDLNEEDWIFFKNIFNKKDPKLFQYQSQAIYATAKGKIWEKQQQELLKKIIQEKVISHEVKDKKIKWNEVSKQLFQLSDKKYFRSAKQCRQKWNNHLDPSKIKGQWKAEQCLMIFQYVKEHGKKWASLVKLLNDTRNEHSVKNKFNSIIKKHRKQHRTQNQQDMYGPIINRIKKSIEARHLIENAELSFDLQDCFEGNASDKQADDQSKQSLCHPITTRFMKLLQEFSVQKCSLTKFSFRQKQYQVLNKYSDFPTFNGFYSQKYVPNYGLNPHIGSSKSLPYEREYNFQFDKYCPYDPYAEMEMNKKITMQRITSNEYSTTGRMYDNDASIQGYFDTRPRHRPMNNYFHN